MRGSSRRVYGIHTVKRSRTGDSRHISQNYPGLHYARDYGEKGAGTRPSAMRTQLTRGRLSRDCERGACGTRFEAESSGVSGRHAAGAEGSRQHET